jgi:geranylgeranyl diphosphate synthase type I
MSRCETAALADLARLAGDDSAPEAETTALAIVRRLLAAEDAFVVDGSRGAYLRYGGAVGEAFQLRDDLLGVFGDPATTGKPAGDDLRTGKPTALLLIARRLATPAQAAQLTQPVAGDLTRLAEIVADTGAVAVVEAMIENRVELALTALDQAPLDHTTHAALRALAVTATQRRS